MKSLINFFTKSVLYAAIPFAISSCSINKNLSYNDPLYYDDAYDAIVEEKTPRIIDNKVNIPMEDFFFDWKYSPYVYQSGMDSDLDGIANFNDPLPYHWGPFLDMNGNGFIDFQDIQVDGFWNSSFYYPYMYSNYWNHHPFFFYWDFPRMHPKKHKDPSPPSQAPRYDRRRNQEGINPPTNNTDRRTNAKKKVPGTEPAMNVERRETPSRRYSQPQTPPKNYVRPGSISPSQRRDPQTNYQQTPGPTYSPNNNSSGNRRR